MVVQIGDVHQYWARVRQFFADLRAGDKNAKAVGRIILLYIFLVAFQVIAWIFSCVVASRWPFFWGLTALAYSFGLRFPVIFCSLFFPISGLLFLC
jgi:hypothetical protein